MGYGSYSHAAHRAITDARSSLPREKVFKQRECHPLMNPHGVRFRESRDSDAHPESLGIVFALDVTGSMGDIPDLLARQELPSFMKTLLDCGIDSPQVLFTAFGDATCDRAPLQVGQFESEAELMDQWLTWSYLEGGGGGQFTESYELAMYFAARHTAMDCWEKRKHRGYFFMTGDEHPYPRVSRQQVKGLIGDELEDDVPVEVAVRELQKTFEPFFLVPDPHRAKRCECEWRDLMGDHVIVLEDSADTCLVAAALVGLCEGALKDLGEVAQRLEAGGATKKRAGRVVRSLTPFAETLGKAGVDAPELEDAPVGAKGASGHGR